jgi:glycosyltransferase involved in cell wall biosynthesis
VIFDENNKEDAPEIFRKAFILLAPLRVAGGTSYKILEAMASGTAVVTTPLGVEGLEAKDKTHVLVAEEPNDLAKLIFNLLIDHSLYRKLTLNSRKFVQARYDWKIIAQKLNEVYMSCL